MAARAQLKTFVWPLLLVLPALAAALSPRLAEWMVYDRAAILDGELWRLLSGHWVHFSAVHLLDDAAVLAACAWIVARLGYRHFPLVCLLAAPAISLALLLWQPQLQRYGGLSGLAVAGCVLAGLLACGADRNRARFGCGLLLLVSARLLFDLRGEGFALVDLAHRGVVPVPLSHLAGALCGLLAWLAPKIPRRRAGTIEVVLLEK